MGVFAYSDSFLIHLLEEVAELRSRFRADSLDMNNAFETINAAASAIAAAENNRITQSSAQKRRLGSCWSIYWCFGFHKQSKRIGHAVLVPEPESLRADAHAAENPIHTTSIALPFVAPPSSPASFLQSEPPSADQSPAELVSFTSLPTNVSSPGVPNSIFAIGPYAHETQLVSPPVFSTFTTEPSTAPFTPPPEFFHLTTPSSPEVPFARLLEPKRQDAEAGQRFSLNQYEFQSYQFQPGSPIGQLISPSSRVSGSGTSSPFPDYEFGCVQPHFLEFQIGDPPKLLDHKKLSLHEWKSRKEPGTLTPDPVSHNSHNNFLLDCLNSDTAPFISSESEWLCNASAGDHRVSFEMTAGDAVRCGEKRPLVLLGTACASLEKVEYDEADGKENSIHGANCYGCQADETSKSSLERTYTDEEVRPRHRKHRSVSLGSVKEFNFNFDNADGGVCDRPDWWSNERAQGKEVGPCKNWSFFPMVQPSVNDCYN